MMVKKFEAKTRYAQYDMDGDGVVTDEELSSCLLYTSPSPRDS